MMTGFTLAGAIAVMFLIAVLIGLAVAFWSDRR